MGRVFVIAWCATVLLASGGRSTLAARPMVNGTFRGRIAYSADGNHNDPDDWAASPAALAIFAEAGFKDRLVHFDYNCILPETNPEWEKIHAESVLGAAKRYGYDVKRFFDCRQDVEGAVADIANAINRSSADDPLYFIIAGPMEVPFRGIEKSLPEKRPFVYCISHSRWNDGFAPAYKFTHTKRSVIESGVKWIQIEDQNRLLSLSRYGQPGSAESFAKYHWMRDSQAEPARFLWERMLVSTRPDPSDAGMAYFLIGGDEQADPEKLRRLIEQKVRPEAMVRKRVRLEAENFATLNGFAIEDRNDRTASHRLSVRGSGEKAGMETRYDELYAPEQGRFDLTVRYRPAERGDAIRVLINGKATTAEGREAQDQQGWQLKTFADVSIAEGDLLTVGVSGGPVSVDYLQLDIR